jgi:cytosine/adenosine deaminase-related metal-dependent hydrolase
MQFWPKDQLLDKYTALKLYTSGSAWFSGEEKLKGTIAKGMYADLVILSADYFKLQADEVRKISAKLTIVNGKIVYAKDEYKSLDPAIAPVIPEWSPVKYYGGYQRQVLIIKTKKS